MNVSVNRAAELMGISPHHLRIKIQHNRFSFASCDKLGEGRVKFAYYINANGLAEHLGLSVSEVINS